MKKSWYGHHYSCCTYANNRAMFNETRLILQIVFWRSLREMGVTRERKWYFNGKLLTHSYGGRSQSCSFALRFCYLPANWTQPWILLASSDNLATPPQTDVSSYSPTLLMWNHSEPKLPFSWRHASYSSTTWRGLWEMPPWLTFRQIFSPLAVWTTQGVHQNPWWHVSLPSFPETGGQTPMWKVPSLTQKRGNTLITRDEELGANKPMETKLIKLSLIFLLAFSPFTTPHTNRFVLPNLHKLTVCLKGIKTSCSGNFW